MEYMKEVFAQYDRRCVRVYQAYNSAIAAEAVALQTFGESFNLNRMTWIKPSFLWMKKNQECILAIDVYQETFEGLLAKAVLTSPDAAGCDGLQWRRDFERAEVYCQWDPDRNPSGAPIGRAAIQIGLKGETLSEFLRTGIHRIEDLTPSVRKWNEQRKAGKLSAKSLPVERLYPLTNQAVRKRLSMK